MTTTKVSRRPWGARWVLGAPMGVRVPQDAPLAPSSHPRTCVGRPRATRWGWPMWAPPATPSGAAPLWRTMGCSRRSRLHMSWVSAQRGRMHSPDPQNPPTVCPKTSPQRCHLCCGTGHVFSMHSSVPQSAPQNIPQICPEPPSEMPKFLPKSTPKTAPPKGALKPSQGAPNTAPTQP